MKSQRPTAERIREATLFEMEKPEDAVKPASEAKVERPFSLPGILLGTSSFTAAGWETKSRWAQMARSGKKMMRFLSEGRYVANVVDGKVNSFGRPVGKNR